MKRERERGMKRERERGMKQEREWERESQSVGESEKRARERGGARERERKSEAMKNGTMCQRQCTVLANGELICFGGNLCMRRVTAT